MPIKVADNLPAKQILESENVYVMSESRAAHQDIRPLRLMILNLMPTKIDTETQLMRQLSNTALQLDIVLLQTATHRPAHTDRRHMAQFYRTFDQVKDQYFDGFIITGAPVEHIEFEDVDYWDELCAIMDWSKTHVFSTLHICWGAQAALYYHYGIEKQPLPQKLSGVYAHQRLQAFHPLTRGLDDTFYIPHSRNTTVSVSAVNAVPSLETLAISHKAGLAIAARKDGRQVFFTGHCEYDRDTLNKEYLRDKVRGLNPAIPENYFPDDDPTQSPIMRWRSTGYLLFTNWVNFIYEGTPYDWEAWIAENKHLYNK
ncbi:MAG: homoserine O-succinyltransferase [Clostridia bacterium]|nr:homoserine O-succinyltransferase [Clostridia bacterium]